MLMLTMNLPSGASFASFESSWTIPWAHLRAKAIDSGAYTSFLLICNVFIYGIQYVACLFVFVFFIIDMGKVDFTFLLIACFELGQVRAVFPSACARVFFPVTGASNFFPLSRGCEILTQPLGLGKNILRVFEVLVFYGVMLRKSTGRANEEGWIWHENRRIAPKKTSNVDATYLTELCGVLVVGLQSRQDIWVDLVILS